MAPAATADDAKRKATAQPRDHTREAVETIVFVVVLVLLLKLFVTEAFVIPTGSMAETLYGIQKIITCGKCGHEFPVNAHDEVQGQQGSGRRLITAGYCCPNCRYHGRVADLKPVPEPRTGDRVLVLKPIYHFNSTGRPARGDVVVFKFPRAPQEKWEAANYIKRCMAFGHTADSLDFIRYQHLVWKREKKKDDKGNDTAEWQRTGEYWTWGDWRPNQTDPFETLTAGPVDNFLGYNDGLDLDPVTKTEHERRGSRSGQDTSWVGDLILECEADVQAGAEVVLELSRGQTRFQARFAGGEVELVSTGPAGKSFGKRPTKITGAGKYKLRFANVDARLWVWVDGKRIDFGTDADYPAASTVAAGQEDKEGWTEENDVAAPASVGAKGGVTVRGLKLSRDIYYTRTWGGNNGSGADLYYVQPGHYLCLGDNSAHSSDSRSWGVVPERLMLGKAVFVFWPAIWHNRVGFIR